MTFHQIIRDRGFTVATLADKVGISRTHLHNIVARRNLPTVYKAIRIAEALEVDVDVLWPPVGESDELAD